MPNEIRESKFICNMPDWFGPNSKIEILQNPGIAEVQLIVFDKNYPPHIFNRKSGQWELFNNPTIPA